MTEQVTEFPIPHINHELNFPSKGGKGAYLVTINAMKAVSEYFHSIIPNLKHHPATHNNYFSGNADSQDALVELLTVLYSLPPNRRESLSVLRTGMRLMSVLFTEFKEGIKSKLNLKIGHVLNYRLEEIFHINLKRKVR